MVNSKGSSKEFKDAIEAKWAEIPSKQRKLIEKQNQKVLKGYRKPFAMMWIGVALSYALSMVIFKNLTMLLMVMLLLVTFVLWRKKSENNVKARAWLVSSSAGVALGWMAQNKEDITWQLAFSATLVALLIALLYADAKARKWILEPSNKLKKSPRRNKEAMYVVGLMFFSSTLFYILIGDISAIVLVALVLVGAEYIKAHCKKLIEAADIKLALPPENEMAIYLFMYSGNTLYKDKGFVGSKIENK